MLANHDLPYGLLPEGIPCGLVYELAKFQTDRNLNMDVFIDWLQTLCPGLQLVKKNLLGRLQIMKKKYSKPKGHRRKPEHFAAFAETLFVEPIIVPHPVITPSDASDNISRKSFLKEIIAGKKAVVGFLCN